MTHLPTLDASELAELVADVRELTETWRRTIPVEDHCWDRNRNRKVRIRHIRQTYPPLLDSLRAMVYPGGTVRGPERRMVPRSRPAASIDPLDRLIRIETELAQWRVRLHGHIRRVEGGDWHKDTLRALVGVAPELDRDLAVELAGAVRRWWRWAAVQVGHSPDELLAGRRVEG